MMSIYKLNKRMQIKSNKTSSTSRTASGGFVPKQTQTEINVPCALRQLSGTERDLLGRMGVSSTHRIYARAPLNVAESSTATIDGMSFTFDLTFNDDVMSQGKMLHLNATQRK